MILFFLPKGALFAELLETCYTWRKMLRRTTAVSRKAAQQIVCDIAESFYGKWGFTALVRGFRCFRDIEGNSTKKRTYAFSFLVGKHREPQSIKAKLFLLIIPIGIVAYAFTPLWDNLCRNSCR